MFMGRVFILFRMDPRKALIWRNYSAEVSPHPRLRATAALTQKVKVVLNSPTFPG
jgi:hypothetical protein